ncbi:MAG: adenosine deaminase [Chloroflexi bacterium]|nr:adenosine deaminase [Chloroflexota bacterium]
MVDTELVTAIRSMPKIDLHRHLEGSLRLETLLSIALEHNITLPRFDVEGLRPFVQVMPGEPRSWRRFLGKFQTLRMFYRSEAIIKRVTSEVVADAAADNVKYMELRFTPQALNNLMQCDHAQVVAWVCEAAKATAHANGIRVRLILSMNRHESVEVGQKVLHAALHNHCDDGVVGIDLAGQEDGYPVHPFRALFEEAKAAGIGVTIHAGEWAGAESVRAAIEVLAADRIGHGIRIVEDPDLVALIAEREIALEVCPTSNVDSGAVARLSEHPLPKLYAQNVKTTINTDDPLVSNITLSEELINIITHTSLTLDDIKQHQIIAARAAFMSVTEREALVAQFEQWLYDDPPT